jgi:alpha-L-fucosidase
MAWWRDARFGMFIHWGIYSVPARGEWVMNTEKIPVAEYEKFAPQFNPIHFDADAWVRMAKRAGMKYIVITSKHHDGFCMWDSKYTTYDIVDATPFKRDVLAELAAACNKEGIVLGLYYSIMDWHHPDENQASFVRYRDGYMKPQLRELLTRYPSIGILWFDGEWIGEWTEQQGKDLENYLRSISPSLIINNRIGKARGGMAGMSTDPEAAGDYGTPEQEIPATGREGVDWESCMTMNDHWGYAAKDHNWKSARTLVRNLVDIASKGGNYLLNVGPQPDGRIPEASILRLAGVGAWMHIYGDAIYGTRASPFSATPWGRCTRKTLPGGTVRLYLEMFTWPASAELTLRGLGTKPDRVVLLGERESELRREYEDDELTISLPVAPPDSLASVIAIDFPGEPVIFHEPVISAPAPFFIDSLAVSVATPQVRGVVRYTLDGSDPTSASPLASGPIVIDRSCLLRARTFFEDRPVAAAVDSAFLKVTPKPAVTAESLQPGLRYSYVEGDWDSIPDFRRLPIRSTGTASSISISPKEREEGFGLLFDGYLSIAATATYTFALRSDDGSRLYLDDSLIVDNDGLHGSTDRSGTAALGRGLHRLRVEFFQKGGGAELRLTYGNAGGPAHVPTQGQLFHNDH